MKVTAKLLRRDVEDLAKHASTEARRRAAVSRAYYASYHRCLRWEGLLPYKSECQAQGGVHARLIERLKWPHPFCGRALMERSESLGKLLEKQRRLRVLADYMLGSTIDGAHVEDQLQAVQQVFEHCADPHT
ncbi:hypothetical protein [Mitsuaria sp. GD03876]|uniref:hypothetical protein n=1 Tax=Mitsuaria sp. GD03876 TaxID=2975399 RepID=UPI00244AC5A7|nr:hypothetical protein [Mitsuaria sp. GD03876]MDH0863456.1 hypothetical protein [Mitsuaria sp. GD03876]